MTNKNLIILLLLLVILPLKPAQVEIDCSPRLITAYQGEKVILIFHIKNNQIFDIRPNDKYFLSYHIYEPNGKLILFENRRFLLPKILRKKASTQFQYPLYFDYPKSGHYIIEFDIVREGKFWGADKQWKTARIQLHLKPLFSQEFKKRYLKTYYVSDHQDINREQYLLRLTLKNSEIIKKRTIFGFSPGSNYPQIWIRDLATFISYAKYHYPIVLLVNNIELFLKSQGKDGEIPDWINTKGDTDKNTVETDQESSLVISAFEIAIDKPLWLKKIIQGKRVFERLELALDWVWKNKRDKNFNLITSGFTADWGDVEKGFPDQRAIKLSSRSTPVLSIYTQSKYIQAIKCLVKIFNYLKMKTKEKKWNLRLKTLVYESKKNLYLKDKHYYIVHHVPSTRKYFKLEKEILPVGGNAEAILSGLMGITQIKKFIEVLEIRRKKYNLRTVSFTLLPPYPRGFFTHPALYNPWNYQNGGEWDWIGGRLVKALFFMGFKKEAKKYLQEIIHKNLKNFNLFEWEDRSGNGIWGAMFYVGSAGVIADAILMGYLGLTQNFGQYRLIPNQKKFFLNIHKNDRFSISRDKDITITIRHLKNKSICISPKSNPYPLCIDKEGVSYIKIKEDNDSAPKRHH